MHGMWKNIIKLGSVALLLVLTACGETSFRQGFDSSRSKAPGSFFIPPAADILLLQDDTGSMLESFSEVSAEIPNFLNRIESRGWDYHFSAMPLTGIIPTPIQVVTSKYDGNWALNGRTQWEPLFPGATSNTPGMSIPAEFFKEPWNFSRFLQPNQVSNQSKSHEEGFKRIDTALNSTFNSTGFLRPGAISIVIVMSNGDDTSGYEPYCRRADGYPIPCPGIPSKTFTKYEGKFRTLISNNKTTDFRLFSIVAPSEISNCLGATSRRGSRYLNMSNIFGGSASANLNICTRPVRANIKNSLDAIGAKLEETLLQLVTKYVAVNPEPDLQQELIITKYLGGDVNRAITISQDSVNGWSYIGNQTNINSIIYPFEMRPITGYIFQLNGTARLIGLDTIKIKYKHKIN